MRPLDGVRKWWGRKLRRRLLISIITMTMILLVLQGALSYRIGYVSVRREVQQGNLRVAALAAKGVSAQHDAVVGEIRFLQYQLDASAVTLPLQVRTMLELRRSSPLTYRALYLFDAEGHLVVHLADRLEDLVAIQTVAEIIERPPVSPSDQVLAAYKAARSGSLFLSLAQIVGADQIPVIYVGVPITGGGGQLSQVMVAELDLRDIWRGVDKIYVGETGHAFVVSKGGMIIAHPDRRYIGQPLAPELSGVLAGYEGQTEYTDPVSGRVMLASYRPVGKQSGWGIVVEQARAEAFVAVNEITSITLSLLLAAVAMAMIVASLIAQSITRPIQRLAHVTRTIADTGELAQDVVVEGHDEVGQLADTFNQMMAGLRRAERQRDAAQASLQAHLGRLEEMVEERSRALEEVQEQLVRREKLAVLGLLAGGIGHELRNPLQAIKNAAYFLNMVYAERDPEPEVKETLEILEKEVGTSERIIASLLDFAHAKPPVRRQVDVNDLVQEALSRVGIPESINVMPRLETLPTLLVDPDQLAQVFGNIILNAVQAMPQGGQLAIESRAAPPDEVAVSISDTGMGIPEENLDRVFEPLFTTKFTGIGLGLTLARVLVEGHGGTIEVESDGVPGKGSTFTVRLPIDQGLARPAS